MSDRYPVDPNDRRAEAARWLVYANEDVRAIDVCLATDPPLRGVAAYHCQQAAEKIVKGMLIAAAAHFPFTHSLTVLGEIAVVHYPLMQETLSRIAPLTSWNMDFRYPAPRKPASTSPPPTPDEILTSLTDVMELAIFLRTLTTPT